MLDRTSIAGVILVILATSFFTIITYQNVFPALEYTLDKDHYLDLQTDVGQGYSLFLWENRSVDLIAQAFVMFAAAVSCLAIFRESKVGEEK